MRENKETDQTTQAYHFEQLHRNYWPQLFLLANQKLGARDEAFDLLQELFVELWDKRDVYPLAELTLSWLKKRLWYKLLNYFRDQGLKQRHLEDFQFFVEQDRSIGQLFDPSDRQLLESEFENLIEAIAVVVAQMPDRMQEVFLLKREHDYTTNEIAQRLGLSVHTVRNHLQAAMKRLRKHMDTQGLSALGITMFCWMMANLEPII